MYTLKQRGGGGAFLPLFGGDGKQITHSSTKNKKATKPLAVSTGVFS